MNRVQYLVKIDDAVLNWEDKDVYNTAVAYRVIHSRTFFVAGMFHVLSTAEAYCEGLNKRELSRHSQ